MIRQKISLFFLCLLLASCIPANNAQPTVTLKLQPPPACAEADLVFSPDHQMLLLVNCFEQLDSTALTSIWAWTGEAWALLDENGPPGRVVASAAYDTKRGELVIYGGLPLDQNECTRDTWVWDGVTWLEKSDTSPTQCDHFRMVYDTVTMETILVGGQSEQDFVGIAQTWAWNGSAWQLITSDGPPPRAHFGFVYDANHEQALLYGGFDGRVFDDFWSWKENVWSQIDFPGPGARSHFGLALNEKNSTLMLFGGAKTSRTFASLVDETWILNNGRWTQYSGIAPSPRGSPTMAYDPIHEVIVLYGGFAATGLQLDDTWLWDGETWACVLRCE